MKIAPQFPLVSLSVFHFQCFLWTRFGKEDMPPHFSFLFLSFRYILLLLSFLTHVVEKQHVETLLSSQTCFAWRKGQAFYDGFHVIVQKSLEVTAYLFLPSQESIQSLCCTGTCIPNIVEIQNCGWEEKNNPTMSYHSSKVLERHYIDIYLIHLNT